MDYNREWGGDRHETFEDGWFENDNNNWVWWSDGEVRATVYIASNDMWAAVWNGAADCNPRRLKRRRRRAGCHGGRRGGRPRG